MTIHADEIKGLYKKGYTVKRLEELVRSLERCAPAEAKRRVAEAIDGRKEIEK